MRTAIRLAVTTAVVLALAAFMLSRGRERGVPPDVPTARAIRVLPPDSVIAGPVDTQVTVARWTLRIVRDTAAREQIVDIAHDGHRAFALRAASARFELAGRDITGDKVPDVVVRQFTGGIHCCALATVLGLGDTLIHYGTIDGADGDIEFDDLDGDGVAEVRYNDFRFAYWRDYAFVETQAPEVIMRFADGHYQAACDLMREPAPSAAALSRAARRLTDGWTSGDPPAEFWGYALELIYAGNADVAWGWLDRSWPSPILGKDEFIKDMKARLAGSPCWSPAAERTTT